MKTKVSWQDENKEWHGAWLTAEELQALDGEARAGGFRSRSALLRSDPSVLDRAKQRANTRATDGQVPAPGNEPGKGPPIQKLPAELPVLPGPPEPPKENVSHTSGPLARARGDPEDSGERDDSSPGHGAVRDEWGRHPGHALHVNWSAEALPGSGPVRCVKRDPIDIPDGWPSYVFHCECECEYSDQGPPEDLRPIQKPTKSADGKRPELAGSRKSAWDDL